VNIDFRHTQVEREDDRIVLLTISHPDGTEEPVSVFLSVDDMVSLRDKASQFVSGQELPGAEEFRHHKATTRNHPR
jgi:hypothetical protein